MRTMVRLFTFAIGALAGSLALPAHALAQANTEKPAFERAPDALERVTWRTRTLVGDERLTRWKFAIPAHGLGVTFLDAIVRADAAVVSFIEASSTQTASAQIAKPLDARLTPDEISAIRAKMGTIKISTYHVDSLGTNQDARLRLFAFARAMEVDTIVVPASAAASLAGVGALADEFGVNVAILADSARPARLVKSLEGQSTRVGIGIDTGLLAQEGVSPRDGIAAVKDRLRHVRLRDRSTRGASATNVMLGQGTGQLSDFFTELNKLNVRPLTMTLDTAGVVKAPADLFRAIDAFETAVQPAYGVHFTELSRTAPVRRDLAKITARRGETLSADEMQKRTEEAKQKIDAAIPKQAYATPKKPRKLLVIDACLAGMSHDTIPYVNVMLERMGQITGAWTTELNNDLNNLKYPKIKEYDAVFLNDNVGELLPDLAVREGLARFVKEGGGLGGVHGTPWASRNWDEFADMIGAKSAPHRIEQGIMQVYDASSPLVKPFNGKPLNWREEFYRFNHTGPDRVRWDDVRVVLTVALDDPAIEPRPWNGYKRPDNTYPVSWIRSYGKGRTFYSSIGHMAETFQSPEIVGHFLAGMQFLMGDLDADTTPNPLRAGTNGRPTQQGAPQAQAGAAQGQGGQQQGRQGGQSQGGQQGPPPVPSISQRPTGSSLGMIRVGAADQTFWFGWRVAMPASAIKGLTFSEALAKADINALTGVEAASTQITSYEVPKPLDYRLQTGERGAVTYRLRELNQQVHVYRVDQLGADAATRRKVFEMAKSLGAPLIVTTADASTLAEIDRLAEEFGISVALDTKGDPKATVSALESRSKRLGIAADLGAWMQAGVAPVDGLAAVKDRLLYVRAADRNALGAKGRVVALGDGAGRLGDFFLAAFKAGVKPLSVTIESVGATEADLVKNLNGFERVMWPAMAERVRQVLATPAGQIRGPDKLDAVMRQQIEAAAPRQALAKPAKPRKLLVTDIQMYSGHGTIPHLNYLLELIAKSTAAFEPTFSNDPELLKYPKIKEFDAVFLNNICGMVHNDPAVREGILRFVREGGGIGGNHAVTFANNNWPEFAEMMGGWAGAHHTEKQMIKIDDTHSPLTKSFGAGSTGMGSFEHTDEFYIFPPTSPYSREKQHILLSIDVEKSDRATANRFCAACTRPDQDYGLAWIRTYGKGRTYFTPLGHTPIMYTDQRWTNHLLAAIQYILGDLDADATPSGKMSGPGSR